MRHAVPRVADECLRDCQPRDECADCQLGGIAADWSPAYESHDRPHPADHREHEQRHVLLVVRQAPEVPLEVVDRKRRWRDIGSAQVIAGFAYRSASERFDPAKLVQVPGERDREGDQREREQSPPGLHTPPDRGHEHRSRRVEDERLLGEHAEPERKARERRDPHLSEAVARKYRPKRDRYHRRLRWVDHEDVKDRRAADRETTGSAHA